MQLNADLIARDKKERSSCATELANLYFRIPMVVCIQKVYLDEKNVTILRFKQEKKKE